MSKTDTPAKVASNDQLGLLQITRHDHPEPQTMVWSELELHAIRAYAGRCVAAERERWQSEVESLRAGIRELVAASGAPTCGPNEKGNRPA